MQKFENSPGQATQKWRGEKDGVGKQLHDRGLDRKAGEWQPCMRFRRRTASS